MMLGVKPQLLQPLIGGWGALQAFIGNRFFCMNDLPRSVYVTWFFQFTFAATGATIISGAVAERCKFEVRRLIQDKTLCCLAWFIQLSHCEIPRLQQWYPRLPPLLLLLLLPLPPHQ
jgi:hypothetical protein